MKTQILIGTLVAAMSALFGCLLLGDGSTELGTMTKIFYKICIFFFPLLLILFLVLKTLIRYPELDISKKLLMIVIVPNFMMIPLIIIWVMFSETIQKALGGG